VRGEALDAVAEIDDGRVEAGGVADRDRVADGPVHGGLAAEFLTGQVADRYHQVVLVLDLGDVPGPQPGQREAVAPGGSQNSGLVTLRPAGPVLMRLTRRG
jgi:hypothetical protein